MNDGTSFKYQTKKVKNGDGGVLSKGLAGSISTPSPLFIKEMEHSTKQDNRPAFQFYPDDWKAEDGLKLCSLAAKGLWIEMLMIMFKSKVRGCLLVNEKQIKSKELAKLTSNNEPEIEILLTELEQYNVYSRLKSGCIYCRRMYREALHEKEISEKRSKAGKLGGRPPKSKKETKKAAPSPSPSSSSSPSPSSSPSLKKIEREIPPPMESLKEYFKEKEYPASEAEKFYDHYQANGWKRGKTPMKDWQASVRMWVRNIGEFTQNKGDSYGKNKSGEKSTKFRDLGTVV